MNAVECGTRGAKANAKGTALAVALACIALGAPGMAAAQGKGGDAYPNKPVRILVGFPPGQATDVVARMIAQKLTDAWGQQVVVDNRPGKGGSLAGELAAKATPDGYTILLTATAPLSINPHVYKSVGYDSLKDFAPVGSVAWLPFILVTSSQSGLRTLPEFIAAAKAKPRALNYGTSGNGSTSHLTMELMSSMSGIQLNAVPYKGVVMAMTDLMAGQLQGMWDTALFLTPHVKGGRVVGLAGSSAKRLAGFPDLPAAAETLPGFESGAMLGFVAPAGVPAPVLAKLNAEVNRILRSAEVTDRIVAFSSDVRTSTPAEYRQFIRAELDKWGKVVKETGARAE